MSAIAYKSIVDTDEDDRQLELLHTNVRKIEAVSKILAAQMKLEGHVRRKA
ncbi:MAG: hypothetical protein IT541_09300 [Hyphomicrobiales bacterium]|jgi:hypothetical protein|nr:hypothetical protein [Hyphomicrobiales bacterium]MBP9174249.1 hypothetical protein [Hyphomicrobiales bacterium]MCC7481702.1 hypothetical protein [Hyphomicrobiales bacterium]HRA93114.1 hypothetical protein [Aestuariivirga sp.]